MLCVGLFLSLAVVLGGAPTPSPSPTPPPGVRYRINVDYTLPMSADTLVWGAFMLNHAESPAFQQIGVSRTGLLLVLEWQTPSRARMTPLRLWPHEVREWYDLIENKVRFCKVESHSVEKDDPYYLAGSFGYALPSRAESSCLVYQDAAAVVEPLMQRLRSAVSQARAAWAEQEEGDGPPGIFIDGADANWLSQFLAVVHENGALQEVSPK